MPDMVWCHAFQYTFALCWQTEVNTVYASAFCKNCCSRVDFISISISPAIYKRGIPYIQIPTTLLACVDSSIGGKTGVDLEFGKNLVGAFYQPRLVVIELSFLKSLSLRQIRSGLAEVIKYGIIKDIAFFELLEANIPKLLEPNLDFYKEIIPKCCKIKSDIVR